MSTSWVGSKTYSSEEDTILVVLEYLPFRVWSIKIIAEGCWEVEEQCHRESRGCAAWAIWGLWAAYLAHWVAHWVVLHPPLLTTQSTLFVTGLACYQHCTSPRAVQYPVLLPQTHRTGPMLAQPLSSLTSLSPVICTPAVSQSSLVLPLQNQEVKIPRIWPPTAHFLTCWQTPSAPGVGANL